MSAGGGMEPCVFVGHQKGCLSFPPLQATVSNSNKIVVSTVHARDKFLPIFPAQWPVSPLCFFFQTGYGAPLSSDDSEWPGFASRM